MRKLGPTLLALPVLLVVYLVVAVKSAGRFRALGFVGAAGLIALVLMVGVRPAPGAAAPPSTARTVAAEMLDPVLTGHSLSAPFTIGFDAPMDGASVAAALRLSPDSAVSFSWDAAGKTLTITPVKAWSADTLYTISVDTSARGVDGAALASPIHVAMLTAKAGTGTLSATKAKGSRVTVDTAFTIHLDRAVAVSDLEAAIQTEPLITGTVTAGSAVGDYLFTPDSPLAPIATYRLTISGLADQDGIAFADAPSISVRTIVAPRVVRFRPVDGSSGADRTSVLSARFTDKMNRKTTTAALKVTADGKAVVGKVTWAETDHVLVFTPKSPLPYGAKVVMTLGPTAASAARVTLAAGATATFTVKAKPAAAKPTKNKPKPKPIKHPGGSGGSGGVSGSWHSVEVYYLSLMNCTRTGGWVTSRGACSSPGGRSVAPPPDR